MNFKYTILLFLFVSSALSQIRVNGYVVSLNDNNPIQNANVIILGTSEGASTDKDGYFQINSQKTYPITLSVSHIGFKQYQITLNSEIEIIIKLISTVIPSEDVSVIGMRSKTTAEVTADVDNISMVEMEKVGASDLSDALRTLSSLQIDQTEGSSQTISIRGSNPNEVAVYLDGIRLNDANTGIANLATIDQNDLQSVELIKGGNTSLYGTGAFGGVLNMSTRLPSTNSFEITRGAGILDDENQDLSINGSGHLGDFSIGGRYSGKARRYHGRSIYTTIFKNLSIRFNPVFGDFQCKLFELQDYLKYPSQDIVENAKTQLGMVRYWGSILGSNNWEIFSGIKYWEWKNEYFSNINRNLKDTNITGRIGHNIITKNFNAIVQIEYENQRFKSDDKYAYGEYINELGDINRRIFGLSTSTKWHSNIVNDFLDQIQWELGYRIDYNNTNQIYDATYFDDDQNKYISTNLDSIKNETISSFKLGVNIQGQKSLLKYNLYLNQGRSKRLPTPNDLILFNHSNLQPSIETESLLSTEVGFYVGQDSFPSPSLLSKFNASGSIFINNYSDKIAYEYYSDIPPAPYNVSLSRISGFEFSIGTSLWNGLMNLKIGYQGIDVNNPIIYPNKPESRFTIHCDIGYKWFYLGYDHFFDGKKFVVYNGFVGNSLQGEENANLNISIKKQIWKVNASVQYVIHNLYSTEPVLADPEIHSITPYNFFNIHREIIKFKLSL